LTANHGKMSTSSILAIVPEIRLRFSARTA